MNDMTITAIIPALNEEIAIGTIVLKAKKYADRVIVIDDGSTDQTSEVAQQAGANVIRIPSTKGKGNALRLGFGAISQDLNGDLAIVTIDADGQHNPDEIPKMIEPILAKKADMVIGSRYMNGNKIPMHRRIGQIILDHVTNLNSGYKITDTQSGFRSFSIDTLPVFKFRQNGFSIESEMLIDALNAGLLIKEVDVGVRYDVDCSTENALKHGLKVFIKILQDMEFNKPLYYFTIPGMFSVALGIAMGLYFLDDYYHGKSLYFGPSLLMILLTLVGMFMAFTGIILHSISRAMQRK
jgi:glycosyltransferase involved in cell wall biosynthesis